jgi:hypothetical protein
VSDTAQISRRPAGAATAPVRKVTVVTVTYNARDVVRLTMESVIRQSFPEMEHVVIDGGSTDGTQDVVREYELGHFVSEKDKGVYDAMDKGAKAATGDIVIFLNAGDTFYDDSVCEEVARFFDETRADIVFGNILPVYLRRDDRHDHGAFTAGRVLDLGYMRNRSQLRDESIHHQATFYRRSIFEQSTYASPEPAATGEYNLLLSAVFRHGARVRYMPRNISRFVLGGISTKDFDAEWKRYVAARDILRRLYIDGAKDKVEPWEFHGGKPPVAPPAAAAGGVAVAAASRRSRLKGWLRSSRAFRLYDRLALSLTERVANRLLPYVAEVPARLRSQDLALAQLRAEVGALRGQLDNQLQATTASIRAEAHGLAERLDGHITTTLLQLGSLEAQQRDATSTMLINQGRLLARTAAGDDFADRGFKVTSHWDEDGLIQYLVDSCDIPDHTFVEFGVGDYSEANTRFLVFKDNWSGLILEGNTADVEAIRNAPWYWRYTVNAVNTFITRDNINTLLTQNGMGGDIGLLSVDIDGVDYWVWQAIEAISPRIVICEYNGIYGGVAAVSVPYAEDFDRFARHYSGLYAGASLQAMVHLGRQKGYTFIGTNAGGNNAFFLRDDVFASGTVKPSQRGFFTPLFREARTADGTLSYLGMGQSKHLIADLPVVDVTTGAELRVGDLPELSNSESRK